MRPHQLVTVLFAVLLVGCSISEPERLRFSELSRGRPAPTTCPIHHAPTETDALMSYSGFVVFDTAYIRARLRLFPYSFLSVWSGSCAGPDSPVVVGFCPKCREAERQWVKLHRPSWQAL
jgi:hypothetical protein